MKNMKDIMTFKKSLKILETFSRKIPIICRCDPPANRFAYSRHDHTNVSVARCTMHRVVSQKQN